MSEINVDLANITKFWNAKGSNGHKKFTCLLNNAVRLRDTGNIFGFNLIIRFINEWLNVCSFLDNLDFVLD
jgi:hypothetical protein